jgi:hypothetical protein
VAWQHVEATTGPVAVGGRTISLVARTSTLTLGRSARAVAVWSRPRHVEILDRDGRRDIVPVRDYHLVAGVALAVAATIGAAGAAILVRGQK